MDCAEDVGANRNYEHVWRGKSLVLAEKGNNEPNCKENENLQ